MLNKEELIIFCKQLLDKRLDQVNYNIKQIQNDANNETKSAMGDKYETGRAMLQNEKAKHLMQKESILQDVMALGKMKVIDSKEIAFGSLVQTSTHLFFISISLGEIKFEDEKILAISAASPIGKLLIGKKVNEEIVFRGSSIIVKSIY